MELLFDIANPIMIIISVLVVSLIIFISKRTEQAWPLIIVMVGVIGLLIFHTITLDGLESGSPLISETYHCIAVELVLILLSFISYLWVDDIIAKNKKLKSYDDSLSWFWNKI